MFRQNEEAHPIQWRRRALGEYSLALPPNLFSVGPHGHSLQGNTKQDTHQARRTHRERISSEVWSPPPWLLLQMSPVQHKVAALISWIVCFNYCAVKGGCGISNNAAVFAVNGGLKHQQKRQQRGVKIIKLHCGCSHKHSREHTHCDAGYNTFRDDGASQLTSYANTVLTAGAAQCDRCQHHSRYHLHDRC